VTIRRSLMCLLLLAGAAEAPGQVQSIVDSPHNLSAVGPSAVRALTEEQVCRPGFLDEYVELCRAAAPLPAYLCGVLGLTW